MTVLGVMSKFELMLLPFLLLFLLYYSYKGRHNLISVKFLESEPNEDIFGITLEYYMQEAGQPSSFGLCQDRNTFSERATNTWETYGILWPLVLFYLLPLLLHFVRDSISLLRFKFCSFLAAFFLPKKWSNERILENIL